MSSIIPESSREGLDEKQSSPTIRKYLVSPTKPVTKPLACNENIIASPKPSPKPSPKLLPTPSPKPTTDNVGPAINKKTKTPPPPDKGRSVVEMLNATRSTVASTSSINKRFPSMKRSYSAITHLDTANKTWLSQPLKSRKRNYVKEDTVSVYSLFVLRQLK